MRYVVLGADMGANMVCEQACEISFKEFILLSR